MSAQTTNEFDLCFELAAVLSEHLLAVQAIGEAALSGDMGRMFTAVAEAQQCVDEARAALVKFHEWAEAES